MQHIFIRSVTIIITLGLLTIACFSQVKLNDEKLRIYNFPMNPRQHPDDLRRLVKPPDATVFGNQTQFMALRGLDGDYKKSLDTYTLKYDLGNIIWPAYPLIYQENLTAVVQELKKRNLFLFDLWGYVPGSGPGGYWQQFAVPQKSLDLFDKELGNHWLGMDNGEQDRRYVGGFASQMVPQAGSRIRQYLNFQNHFQGLTERLGSKMSTLVSLNFGHYFLKEGVYTMIGAETAQGLPNAQVYYSFIRGAGKQYGVPWFGNASVWNRWGWKNYSGITSDRGGDREGTSLSLLKRLIYSHIMYNCVAVGFEASFLNKKEELSPIGKIQQSANKWVKKYGSPGNLYTPVAIMGDFFSGWTFPRHLYSGNIYRVWGNLPYEEGDYMMDGMLNLFYPGYQGASYFHDETGFLTPTPFGDVADCFLSDCPLWLLQQYPVLVIGNKLKGGAEIKDKLEKYVETGGHLILTSGNLEQFPNGLFGISSEKGSAKVEANTIVVYNNNRITEGLPFEIQNLNYPKEARVIASYIDKPLVVEHLTGKGKITVFATPFGLSSSVGKIPESREDLELTTPFPLLNHVRKIVGDILSNVRIFEAGKDLSVISCHKNKGEFTLAISNNTWTEKPFKITSNIAKILKITELPVDCQEQMAIGFLPKTVISNTGKNSDKSIAGGDIRIFDVKIEDKNINDIPLIQAAPNPVKRGLTLRNISSVKEEILLRPTFFQHYDRVIIDWKYLYEKETAVLSNESGWIRQQGLKLIVDLSSGINLFPDLRMINNDSIEYLRSLKVIKSVLDKMSILGAEDLIICAHRSVENNFSNEQFSESLKNTLRDLCLYAGRLKININFRMTQGRNPGNTEQIYNLLKEVNEPNFYATPVSSLILADKQGFEKNLGLLKDLKCRMVLLAAPEEDIYNTLWNTNKPIIDFPDKLGLRQILSALSGTAMVMDGLYDSQDEEYLDIRTLEELIKQ